MLIAYLRKNKSAHIVELFDMMVIVTEKIHGSNICIVLEWDSTTGWNVVRYHSRKLVLEADLTDAQLNGTPLFPILKQHHDRLISRGWSGNSCFMVSFIRVIVITRQPPIMWRIFLVVLSKSKDLVCSGCCKDKDEETCYYCNYKDNFEYQI